MARIGILHPGEMGAGLGGRLAAAGHAVLWASRGRSPETARRAEEANLEDVGGLDSLLPRIEFLLSICPPHAAESVASQVATGGFRGTYIDANAISPATAAKVSATIEGVGGSYVDAGIIGLPPGQAEAMPRLYLSGARAPAVADLFGESGVATPVLSQGPFSASALKMSHAAWTKGATALLLAVEAAARRAGVETALDAEWERMRPWYAKEREIAEANAKRKSWRWVGEMEEVAATFAELDLPAGFHAAAAQIFDREP